LTAEAVDGSRVSVAIVDDDAAVRVALRRLCEAVGLTATAYASGGEFIESLQTGAAGPDCLVLDIQMAGMTGLEVHRHLADRGVRLPTVVITGDDAPEIRSRYVAAGVSEYLRKPVGGTELRAAVERAIGKLDGDSRGTGGGAS
jgi:FixJ family two-component response regulator